MWDGSRRVRWGAGRVIAAALAVVAVAPVESTEPVATAVESRPLAEKAAPGRENGTGETGGATEGPGSGEAPARQRLREGDSFSGVGRFELTGDRLTFYGEDGAEPLGVLPNLALERVARVLENHAGAGRDRVWQVTGAVTEYRGVNYLLLHRVVLKARAAAAGG